ncbi:hypothetical protein MKW92_042387 [Papaver armeniacum]|nr:hypothetical protein MKW92_046943 [Papaver armeniacum]KAI3912979.1 hypothetical protein MKW92_042387 [Papaver armeniacum]
MILRLFNYYSSKYGTCVRAAFVEQPNFDEQDSSERLLSATSTTVLGSSSSNNSSISELVKYLELDVAVLLAGKERGSNFDILQFWNTHGSSFPILQIMARDLLTPPASTVASESVFSASGRVLSKKRSRLSPDILEALVCIKDWNDAKKRRQDFNDTYEEVFSDVED